MGGQHSTPVVQFKLLDLPLDEILHLLDYVPLKDLSSLSISCSHLNYLIGLHLEHQMSDKMLASWVSFLSSNSGMLTQVEKTLEHIRNKVDIEDRRDMYRLLYIRPDKELQIRRVGCVEESVTIIGRNSSNKIRLEFDDTLQRAVVVVDRVRWLQVGFSWDKVAVGKYEVSVRMRLEENFSWPHTKHQPSVWSVDFPVEEDGDRTGNLTVLVDRAWWRQVRKGRDSVGDLGIKMDVLGKWVRIVLPEVTVKKEGVVSVDVRDTICNWWKGGISFDFLELKKVG